MAARALITIKEELMDTSSSSPENYEGTEDCEAGIAAAVSNSICIKTEPYNISPSVLQEDNENKDGPMTDGSAGGAVNGDVACNTKQSQGSHDTLNSSVQLLEAPLLLLYQDTPLGMHCTVTGDMSGEPQLAAEQRQIPEEHGAVSLPDHERQCPIEYAKDKTLQLHRGELCFIALPCAQALDTAKPVRHKSYKCEACGATFRRSTQLERHMLMHAYGKPYRCAQCDVGYHHASSLRKHLRKHTAQMPHRCELCQKTFTLRESLRRHLRTHSGEKPYKCELCHMSFTQHGSLHRHLRRHDGGKPHECNLCPASFRDTSALKYHVQARHTGEKPFKCDLCPAAFVLLTTLKRHKDIHTGRKPYRCGHCSAEFSDSSNLKRHLAAHKGERPYRCKLCPSAFSGATSLKYHTFKHSGEKPYKCGLCPASYRQPAALKRHVQKHNCRGDV